MVDSLPPSGIDLDSETIITNSNGKLSVPLDDEFLDVGSSGEVKLFETTYYLGNFAQDSGDWTGIDRITSLTHAEVNVGDESELPKSISVTADLTDIDKLNFKIDVDELRLKIKFDGDALGSIDSNNDGYKTLEISGLDDYGTNTTVEIEAYDDWNGETGQFYLDYVRGLIQTESRKIELVDTGGL